MAGPVAGRAGQKAEREGMSRLFVAPQYPETSEQSSVSNFVMLFSCMNIYQEMMLRKNNEDLQEKVTV
jgi:hypothetical protein